jgi:hypothetical protein
MTIARNPQILWRRSGDRVLLRDRRGTDTHVLDGTGALVWLHLEEPTSLSDLVDGLARAFAVRGTEVADDLASFVEQLVGCDILLAAER